MEDRETARMRKYGESKTTRIMMASVPHVTSGLGLRKFQADGLLLTRMYKLNIVFHTTLRQSVTCYNELCSVSSSSSSPSLSSPSSPSRQARRHSYLESQCVQQHEYQPQVPSCLVRTVWPQPVGPSCDAQNTSFVQNKGWKLETNNLMFIIMWLQESTLIH